MMRRLKGALIPLALAVLIAAPFGVCTSHAQNTRSYDYGSIKATYTVHTDSTVDVEEVQTYEFKGTYHQAERIIPHKGSDAITDIRVIDTATGEPLTRSVSPRDKMLPSSWGKYAVTDKDGSVYVDWYYNLTDTTHTWTIRYTLHGAVSFYKDHDELYWNIFSGYDVPVKNVEAVVILPAANTLPTATWYVNGNHNEAITRPDDRTFDFTATNFASQEAATFAAGWQKGLVDQHAYWRDWWSRNWPYLASLLLLLGSALFSFGYWYVKEYLPRKGRVIIAEYEPPLHIPPALAAYILSERMSQRSWAATIVDLAVRGYVTITELPRGRFSFSTDYEITRKDSAPDETTLMPYEKSLLVTLFENGATFSTRDLRKSRSKQRAVYAALLVDQNKIRSDADSLGLYARGLKNQFNGRGMIVAIAAFIAIIVVWISSVSSSSLLSFPYLILAGATIASIAILSYRLNYDAVLNEAGQKMRADLLGFKLYLHTAERYRLQNLTPETFEKYLPYAMIFGVEKKWAKAFESMTMSPPSWYVGANTGYMGSGSASSFSPTAFASGFSASFASSFASSGASGMSSGGGSAGGGGGGGGGGAS